jgi:hypothetical protein
MKIWVDKQGTIEQFNRLFRQALAQERPGGLLVLTCDANGFEPESLDPMLRSVPVPVFGGVFPAIIHDDTKLDRGTIILPIDARVQCIELFDISNPSVDFVDTIDGQAQDISTPHTLFVFLDGFARRINAFISGLFTVFGLECNYIGGGTGSLSIQAKPCVITNHGLKTDAAVLALVDSPSSVGVCHGWESIAGPFRVTESQGNTIQSIDWRPAFDLYRSVLRQYGRVELTRDNFFAVARGYPFGIAKLSAERVVRGPVRVTPEGYLLCVGDLPEGSFVDILHGEPGALIRAAGEARRRCMDNLKSPIERPVGIFIDCISRVLFLADDFPREVEAVHISGQQMVGACTIGEIANAGSEYIEFYNKTAVVGLLESI